MINLQVFFVIQKHLKKTKIILNIKKIVITL
ncbi:MAG: hypothetical protein RLY43_2391 [Bacteroidota bacterium]